MGERAGHGRIRLGVIGDGAGSNERKLHVGGGMSKNSATSADVALLAKVSQSAVSRTFTPGGSVSAETRERVLKAAQDLGYRPNALARAMISGRSRLIALLVAYLDNQFLPAGFGAAFPCTAGGGLSCAALHDRPGQAGPGGAADPRISGGGHRHGNRHLVVSPRS